MALRPVSFRWEAGLIEAVDGVRGDVPRSVWVRRAVEVALAEARFGPGASGPGERVEGRRPFVSPETVERALEREPQVFGPTSPAPAEQPEGPKTLAEHNEAVLASVPPGTEAIIPVHRSRPLSRSEAFRRATQK